MNRPLPHEDGLSETPLDSEVIVDGHFLKVKRDHVLLPDGKRTVREYIEHPGAVMIIPVFDDGRVLMERQYRYPVGQVMIEFPAGKLDAGEDARECAIREMREETGYTVAQLTFVTRIHPVISYSTEFIDLYLATGLTAGERKLDDGEFLETFTASFGELMDWVKQGRITDVKTIIGAFWLEKIRAGEWQAGAAPWDGAGAVRR